MHLYRYLVPLTSLLFKLHLRTKPLPIWYLILTNVALMRIFRSVWVSCNSHFSFQSVIKSANKKWHRRSKEDQRLLKRFKGFKRGITWIQIKVYVWVHSLILQQQMYEASSLFFDLSSIVCRYSVLLLININSGTWYGEKTLYFWVLPFHWDAKWCCWGHCLRAWWGGMSYFLCVHVHTRS